MPLFSAVLFDRHSVSFQCFFRLGATQFCSQANECFPARLYIVQMDPMPNRTTSQEHLTPAAVIKPGKSKLSIDISSCKDRGGVRFPNTYSQLFTCKSLIRRIFPLIPPTLLDKPSSIFVQNFIENQAGMRELAGFQTHEREVRN